MKSLQTLKKHYKNFDWLACTRLLKKLKLKNYQTIFKSSASLSFAGREIADLKITQNTISITANFLGLQGAATPLPLHFTEAILQDDPDDSVLNDLLNFFNQRNYEALIAIDTKYHYLAQGISKYQDPLSINMQRLCGWQPIHHEMQASLFYYLFPGLRYFIGRQQSKQGICLLLQQLFNLPKVSIRERVQCEIFIPKASQNQLGLNNSHLGGSLMLGQRVYQASQHFELHLEVTSVDEFLPSGKYFLLLKDLLKFILKTPLLVTLVLHAKAVKLPFVAKDGLMQLGFTSVLVTEPRHAYTLNLPLIT